jgi:hypothetical protein
VWGFSGIKFFVWYCFSQSICNKKYLRNTCCWIVLKQRIPSLLFISNYYCLNLQIISQLTWNRVGVQILLRHVLMDKLFSIKDGNTTPFYFEEGLCNKMCTQLTLPCRSSFRYYYSINYGEYIIKFTRKKIQLTNPWN